MDNSSDASQCGTGAAAPIASKVKMGKLEVEDLDGATESLPGTEEEPEDNGQPADQESLLPLNITDGALGKAPPDGPDVAPEQADDASPRVLEQLKSSVKASVKDVLVPGGAPTQNDNEARSLEQAEESRGKMVCMTIVTIAKLAVENALGLTFLYSSIADCGKMIGAMKGCVGSFEECVLPMLSLEEVEACQLRSDQNAEYAEWASTCKPRGDPLTLMVVAPSAASLAMTIAFTAMFFVRTYKRIRVRAAPQLKWNHFSELHLKAILRVANLPDTGTKKELIDRVSLCMGKTAEKTELKYIDDGALDTMQPLDEPTDDHEGQHAQLEDKSKLSIAHEELEKMKLQDTAFETFVFILAIALFAYKIQPMLMQKHAVGCGGSFCPNDLMALSKNVRCDEASIFITGSANCSALWTMEGATQCQQSGPVGWGCCIPIDNFFPCVGIATCELDVCDVKEVALRSFRAMYFFNAVEDVWDLAEVLVTVLTFKTGLTALWSTASNKNAKIGAVVVIITFLICLVVGTLLFLPADASKNLSWTPFRDACSPRPCGDHGNCMDLPGKQAGKELEYTCLCENGWAGPTCQIALACASSPCQAGGGICKDDESDGSFVCICNQGYAGELCDQVGVGEPCNALQLPNGQEDGQCIYPDTTGGSCFLTCLAPYLLFSEGVLMPSVTRSCQPDGTWTGTMPVCDRPDCGGTTAVAYSIRGNFFTRLAPCIGDTMYGGDPCSISCDTGFFLSSGSGMLTCGTDGTWIGNPVCTECTAITHCAGDVTCTSDSDHQCSQCETGYTASAQCNIIDCGPTIPGLDSQASATCTGDTQYGGDDCTATCNAGWQSAAGVHQGTSTFRCSASEEAWTGSLVCRPMSCGVLVLEHGSTSGQCAGSVGDSCVAVTCEIGYSLSHATGTARECQSDGTWSGTAVSCIGIPCTANTIIANSDRTASNPCVTGTGSDCSFVCDAGFHVQGTHTCAANGNLFGGSCARNSCEEGLTLPNSPTTCAGVFETECPYVCNAGMSASTPHVCGADGSFSGGECISCSGVLQDLLDWLVSSSAMFSFCPTADISTWQGNLLVKDGKTLLLDGSRGPGGTVKFNGGFSTCADRFASTPCIIDPSVAPGSVIASNIQFAPIVAALLDTSSLEVTVIEVSSDPVWVVGFYWDTFLSTAVVCADGTVWAYGANSIGQLAIGNFDDQTTPVKVPSLSGIVHAAGHRDHVVYGKDDGTVWGMDWGCMCTNIIGNLANGDYDEPQQVSQAVDVVQMCAGQYVTVFLDRDMIATAMGHLQMSISNVVQVACGSSHSLFLKADGTVWGAGSNWVGELGVEPFRNHFEATEITPLGDSVVQISATGANSVVVKEDGSAWGFGRGMGRHGDQDDREPHRMSDLDGIAQVIADSPAVLVRNDGTVWKTDRLAVCNCCDSIPQPFPETCHPGSGRQVHALSSVFAPGSARRVSTERVALLVHGHDTCVPPSDTTGYGAITNTDLSTASFDVTVDGCATGYHGTPEVVPCGVGPREYTLRGCATPAELCSSYSRDQCQSGDGQPVGCTVWDSLCLTCMPSRSESDLFEAWCSNMDQATCEDSYSCNCEWNGEVCQWACDAYRPWDDGDASLDSCPSGCYLNSMDLPHYNPDHPEGECLSFCFTVTDEAQCTTALTGGRCSWSAGQCEDV